MENIFLAMAREEESRLEAELHASATYKRLELVRALIRSYEPNHTDEAIAVGVAPASMESSTSTHDTRQPALAGGRMSPSIKRPRDSSMSATVCKVAEEFLTRVGKRADSSAIAEELKRLNIEVPGVKPASVISSYLSTNDKFDNVRGQGYGLVSWGGVLPTGRSVLSEFEQSSTQAAPLDSQVIQTVSGADLNTGDQATTPIQDDSVGATPAGHTTQT